ncbi:MAG: hypothetical protein K5739_03360 [Lachnospiraceae bacterium]|nr:hypothetical protein [Lachnospiraceae bacterium]
MMLILLIAQVGFILYVNLFRADTIIDFDSSSAYLHEMEMGSQCKLFPAEYGYQNSLDLDSASILSAALYHFIGDIFMARGIANSLMMALYLYVTHLVLRGARLSGRWKRFGMLLFLIPYSVIMLGYWRMLFGGGGFFALRALVPLLLISLQQDLDRGEKLIKYAGRAALTLIIVFLTGLSSGAYILLSAVFPFLLWEFFSAFSKGDYKCLRSKRTALAIAAGLSAALGMAFKNAMGLSTIADGKYILTSNKWIDALLSSFAGLFELFGGLTIHEQVKLFSPEGIGTVVNFAATCILITGIVYTIVSCRKKRELSNMHGYIFTLLFVNLMMFCFVDLKYGENVFESRFYLVPILPAFFLLAGMMEDFPKKGKLNNVQIQTLRILVVGIFAASMLYGDAQLLYAKKALGSDKLKELNAILEEEGVQTAITLGDDNKVLGRKLRVYGKKMHYLVLSDGAVSARQTTFGGTTRYLDNAMQPGKVAVIASEKAFKTLPQYLQSNLKYLREYDEVKIYVGDESRFDCVGGIVPRRDTVVDFAYSPGYTYKNATMDETGALVMGNGGGSLESVYDGAEGTWHYIIYYDIADAEDGPDGYDVSEHNGQADNDNMPARDGQADNDDTADVAGRPDSDEQMNKDDRTKSGKQSDSSAHALIQIADKKPVRIILDPGADYATAAPVKVSAGEQVKFSIHGSEGLKIRRIEISRN